MRDLLHFIGGICIGLAIAGMLLAAFAKPNPSLIGYGCDGTNGALYAFEEDAFPRCVQIEAR